MDFVVKKGEIVLTEDNKSFQVVETIKFENESYLLLMKLPEDVTGVLNMKKPETIFVREVVAENKDYILEPVESEKLKESLLNQIKKEKKPNKKSSA